MVVGLRVEVCKYVYAYVSMDVRNLMYVRTYVRAHVCMYVVLFIVCWCICACICMHVGTCIYMYACIDDRNVLRQKVQGLGLRV